MEEDDDFLAGLLAAAEADEAADAAEAAADPSRARVTAEERRERALRSSSAPSKLRRLSPLWFGGLEASGEAAEAAAALDSQLFDARLEAAGSGQIGGTRARDLFRARLQVGLARVSWLHGKGRARLAWELAGQLLRDADEAGETSDHLLVSVRDLAARAACAAGRWDEAAPLVRLAIDRRPGDPDVWALEARVRRGRGRPPLETAEAYGTALQLAPRHAAYWLEAARLARDGGVAPFAWLAALLALVMYRNGHAARVRYAATLEGRERAGIPAGAAEVMDALGPALGLPPSGSYKEARSAAPSVVPLVTEPWQAALLERVSAYLQGGGGGTGAEGDDEGGAEEDEIASAADL